MTRLQLVSYVGALCVMACAAFTVIGLVGTTKPAGPQTSSDWFARLWNGGDHSRRGQRMHRFMLLTAVGAGVGAWLFTGLPVVGLLAMTAVPGAPWLFRVGADERRLIELVEAVGEWTRRLKDISATGAGLQQAIVASANTAPVEIGRHVRDLAARLQAGVDLREALLAFADVINDPVCDQVVAALLLHLSDRGDRLGDVLGAIATATSAEVATRREVDAKRTQSRFAVKFLTIITVGVIAFGLARPQYMQPYHTPSAKWSWRSWAPRSS